MNKQRILVIGGILVLVFGSYFLFFRGGGSKGSPEVVESQNLSTVPPASASTLQEEKDSIPLFIQYKEIIDPFSKKSLKEKNIEEALKLKQKEIELLKAQIQELKLKKEISKLAGGSYFTGIEQGFNTGNIHLLGTISIGNKRKAYLLIGEEKIWLQVGEEYGGIKLISVNEKTALISLQGKNLTLRVESEPGTAKEKEVAENEETPVNEGEEIK